MGDGTSFRGLFPFHDDGSSADASNVIEARNTGVLPYQRIDAMVRARAVNSLLDIEPDQIQPASLDLRLGRYAYRVRASFLPGPSATVMERIKELGDLNPVDLENGAVFERGVIYVVELQETVRLNSDTLGVANPKSSTGRLDILTRLITDRATAFDRVEKGYEGPLFLEVAPLTFSVIVHRGTRLNQIRFHRDRGILGGILNQTNTEKLYSKGQLIRSPTALHPLRDGVLVPVTVDLEGSGLGTIVGYKAKKHTNRIDLRLLNHYDPREFWDKIESVKERRLNLDEGDFYILATLEDVGVPPQTAAEMVPYDTRSGEFRVHYAGFFDPGFGWADGTVSGSKAVLEVRTYGVSFTLEHGQIVGWLRYSPIAGGFTTKLYGADMNSNYQGQGVALAKQFKKWPV
jgi:dCTP deaminase